MKRHFLSPVVTKAVAGFVVGCALLVLPARADAQTAPPPAPPPAPAPSGGGGLGQGFGDAGQFVISGEDFLGFTKVNNEGWRLVVQPAVDYFVIPSVSAGLVAAFILTGTDDKEELIAARGGYNLNVTENLGAWPKVGIAFDHHSFPGINNTTVSLSTTWITLNLPILYHILPHLFAGLGPFYNLKIAGDGNTGFGFSSVVGGWF
jgi:hypothetical protein